TEGRDPKTGQVKRTRPKDQTFFNPGMGHQRCYRNKATSRYLVFGRSGVEFIDLKTGKPIPNHWTRGTCQYGVIPCNGLLYVPPHSCACFYRSKLGGFNCFAPRRASALVPAKPRLDERLQRGPAYAQMAQSDGPRGERGQHRADSRHGDPTLTTSGRESEARGSSLNPERSTFGLSSADWPTYRHDPARTGATSARVSAELQPGWKRAIGGRLSSLVAAEGKVFVAQVDAGTVHALDAATGEPLWSFVAGGRIDSPPTVWSGRVVFGSADGWVYCLRDSDGALAWRFRAAPKDQRIVSYGQVESLWPVSGSVLVHEGVVYCAAGRSSYLEGGIRLCRLDARTGRLLSETVLDDRDPETGYQKRGVVRGTNMPGALTDVLSCDGRSVYLRHRRFSLAGEPLDPDVPHLFAATGFLDDTWWHRTYWVIGTVLATNYGGWPRVGNRAPAGRILVMDDSTVYGFGRNQYIHHGAHVGIDGATIFHFRPDRDKQRRFTNYQAFAIRRDASRSRASAKAGAKRRRGVSAPRKEYVWTQKLPIWVRAMVLAGDTLFLAGPPDIFSADDPLAAVRGTDGGMLWVLSTADGKTLAKYDLQRPPVFDGMMAIPGRLYLATTDGQVICFAGKAGGK
ncbi:MAG: PQQ-binding-like beta-propeller repeat protein, partial [Planctomycetes bacterium]|nr:PQQ-binding-like beta-propeller repeat protein [Planctomycetota bacterium]